MESSVGPDGHVCPTEVIVNRTDQSHNVKVRALLPLLLADTTYKQQVYNKICWTVQSEQQAHCNVVQSNYDPVIWAMRDVYRYMYFHQLDNQFPEINVNHYWP